MAKTVAPPRSASAARAFEIADVAATALFAIEGATAGLVAGLDLLGIVVVGICTALVGGVLRDLLLGDAPPAAFSSPVRIVVAVLGSLAAWPLHGLLSTVDPAVLALDAVALALFAVAGTEKALAMRANALVAVALGTITAVGGGVVRDILISRPPIVLSEGFYASAAILGAAAMVLAARLGVTLRWAMVVGFAVCVGARLAALAYGWELPRVV